MVFRRLLYCPKIILTEKLFFKKNASFQCFIQKKNEKKFRNFRGRKTASSAAIQQTEIHGEAAAAAICFLLPLNRRQSPQQHAGRQRAFALPR